MNLHPFRQLRAIRDHDLRAAGKCYQVRAFGLARAYEKHAGQMAEAATALRGKLDAERLAVYVGPAAVSLLGPHARPLPRLAFDASDGAIRATAAHAAALCAEVDQSDEQVAYARCANLARAYGLEPPDRCYYCGGRHTFEKCKKKIEVGGELRPALLRLCCSRWWRRKLRRLVARRVEAQRVAEGRVSRRAGLYCSDDTLWRQRAARRRNRRILDALRTMNELGDESSLAELAEASISNPELRRHELMTRVKGLEAIAEAKGDEGLFVTWTLESRYHAVLSKTGERNPTYDPKLTPREGAACLAGRWALGRARLAKHGIHLYGMRVAEPHHDGTPHWHLLLFLAPSDRQRVEQVLRELALSEGADEPGAQRYRIKFERINRTKGSAVAYVAKYLAKNVDGHQLEVALERGPDGQLRLNSDDPKTAAERIRAWASTWGIRQFQFFGTPPVTWWRELRRLREQASDVPAIEAARAPADAGDYAQHVLALGGCCVPRDDLPLRTWREATGELTRYEEVAQPSLRGVAAADGSGRALTRPHTWSPPSPQCASLASAPWTRVNNCNRLRESGGFVPSNFESGDTKWDPPNEL